MTKITKNPGALAGATGVGMTFEAATLNVNPIDSTDPAELHHALRIRRLHLRRSLTGPLAARIAALAFDGGVAR